MAVMHGTSNTANGAKPDHPSPIPRRFKWLRRLGLAAAVVVVGVGLLRVLWGLHARHVLDVQIQQYRSANQLVYASEFDAELDAVDERRNAAIRLQKAMEALVGTSTSGVNFTSFYLDDAITFQHNMPAARELMAANAAVLRLVREARHMPDVAWSSRPNTAPQPPFLATQQREFAKLLWFATEYHFRNGNHDEAVGVLRDFLSFNNAVDSEPALLSSIVA